MAITLDGTNGITHTSGTNQKVSLASGTAVASTSGTSVDFILSADVAPYVKRITVMFSGVSLSGTSQFLVQLGTSSGVVSTGYASGSTTARDATATIGGNSTSGFLIYHGSGAANVFIGSMRVETLGSNVWVGSHSGSTGASQGISGGGNITLSGALDRVRITTVNGTDTFDAGSINILYE